MSIINTKYNIKFEFEGDNYFAYDEEKKLHELTTLKGLSYYDECYVGIDEKTIGVLMPTNDERFDLGYYKFVLIDIEQDMIIQEYPVNIK